MQLFLFYTSVTFCAKSQFFSPTQFFSLTQEILCGQQKDRVTSRPIGTFSEECPKLLLRHFYDDRIDIRMIA